MLKVLIAGLFAAATVAAERDVAPVQPQSEEPPSVYRYGEVDITCQQWFDGCRACGRDHDGAPVCSNIGIACQPQSVQCTARKPEK